MPFAQAGPLELDAVRAMNDAVENGIPERGITHQFVPAIHRNLAGYQQRDNTEKDLDAPGEPELLFGRMTGTGAGAGRASKRGGTVYSRSSAK